MSNGADRCRVCDEPLAPGTPFCPRCGTRVEDDAAAQDDEAVTGMVVDDPTAAPGAYEATQAMPRSAAAAPVGVAGAPVDAGGPGTEGPTPEEEQRSRRMRLLVAAIVVVIVLALVVLIALAFTSGGGGGKSPTTSVPSTAVHDHDASPGHHIAAHRAGHDERAADDEPADDEPADHVAAQLDLTGITVAARR